MIKHLVRKAMTAALLFMIAVMPAAMPASALALSPAPVVADSVSDACAGIGLTGGDCNSKVQTQKVNDTIASVVNLLSAIVGLVAVLMIIIGGFKYITSGGDSNQATTARNTILYAIVGLIVVALAQVIVHFVIKHVATSPPKSSAVVGLATVWYKF